MDTNCDAFKNPVYTANEKLAALRSLARKCNVPEEDLALLAIIVAQSMEVVQRDFLSIVGPLLYAPEPITQNMLSLMAPLRQANEKLLAHPEMLDHVIEAHSKLGKLHA